MKKIRKKQHHRRDVSSFSGIDNPIVYQQSFNKNSLIDKSIKHLLKYKKYKSKEKNIFEHRELAGNDENVLRSIGYDIPMGTLMRYPFPEYHTHFDNMEITKEKNIEEIICLTLKLIEIIENNSIIKAIIMAFLLYQNLV